MKKFGIIIALFVAGFAALILYSTIGRDTYKVRVCMTFNGQTACTTAGASSEMTAMRAATEGACANISSGVTDTVKCQNTAPDSVHWLKKP